MAGVAVECRRGKAVTFNAELPALVCEDCGDFSFAHRDIQSFELFVADWIARRGMRESGTFRFMRKALGMTAVQLAELLDVQAETISRWENDKSPIDVGSFSVLAALVEDRLTGQERMLDRLKALREPAEVPSGPVHIKLKKAS
jgi:DNA-binding transcriptional regulator YiaG